MGCSNVCSPFGTFIRCTLMAGSSKHFPHYIQRGLLILAIVLMGISVARLLVSMHQQQERIEILEAQVAQLMADTTRLQIPAYSSPRYYNEPRYYGEPYRHSAYRQHRDYYPSRPESQPTGRPEDSRPLADSSLQAASVPSPAPQPAHKFTEPHQFDINTIDSATLTRIPGIAERTASVILKYRERYGGFYDPRQLQEFLTWDAALAYIDEWCEVWFTANAARIRPVPINTATVSQLQHHPYITHEQAIEIANYRNRHTQITSPKELQQLSTFTEQQIQQLLPYLSFE